MGPRLEAPDIPGAKHVVEWFGYWPSFHDAEVLSISFDRMKGCRISIHTFHMTPEVDSKGFYISTKHAVITFCLEDFPTLEDGFTSTRVDGFNHQNVLGGAEVNKKPEGHELVLYGCFGVGASIICKRMSVTLEPGVPQGSMYQTTPAEPLPHDN